MRDISRPFAIPLALSLAALASACTQEHGGMAQSSTQAQAPATTAASASQDGATGADWTTYHGTWKSYHYSALDQINTGNVKNLEVAWMHFPGRSTRGVQSMPLAQNGVLYYSGSYSRLFALDGATGNLIWSYYPELD